jgi:hypothetical protein
MKDRRKPIYIIDPNTLEIVPSYPRKVGRYVPKHAGWENTACDEEVRMAANWYGDWEPDRKVEEPEDDFSMTANWYGD